MLLKDKRIVVMGLMSPDSLAYAIGQRASYEGAQVIYTVQNTAFEKKILPRTFEAAEVTLNGLQIVPCDASKPEEMSNAFAEISELLGGECIDGLVHSIAYANPKTVLGRPLWEADWDGVGRAMCVSATSFPFLVGAALPYLSVGASIMTMTFLSQQAFPSYGWMSVCKAALEAAARGLANDLGPRARVNCLSAGPQATTAAKNIPGFEYVGEVWHDRAPLGWYVDQSREEIAKSAAMLLSDYTAATTGHVFPVDGGFSAVAVAYPPNLELDELL